METFRIGVSRKVYNATLRDAVDRTGKSAQVVAKELGVGYQTLLHWISFKSYPRTDELRLRVAIYFGIPDDVLFPEEIAQVRVHQQPKDLRLTYAEFEEMSQSWLLAETPTVVELAERTALTETLQSVLTGLLPREQQVLTLRFGLDDGEARTMEAVARMFGVTRERVRQIEAKALRKLRHPSRAKLLRDFLPS